MSSPSAPARRGARGYAGWVLAITLAALVLRAVLAFVVYPGLGFSSDMDAFLRWIRGLDERGPAGFYAADRGANYPPVGLLALWAMRPLADAVGPLVGYTPAEAVVGLVKLPGILGEVGCVPLAAALATRLRIGGPGSWLPCWWPARRCCSTPRRCGARSTA